MNLAKAGLALTGAITFAVVSAMSPVFAASSTPNQSLLNLSSISTTITGLPDPIFSQEEQQYQNSLTGNTGWHGFSHQGGRDITVSFPHLVDIHHVEITLLQNASIGVYFPNEVQFEFEQNGQWYSDGKLPTAIPQSTEKVMTQVFQVRSTSGIEANAVRIHIPVGIWVFARGLNVIGSTTSSGTAASSLTPISNTVTASGPLSPTAPNAYGIHNMLILETNVGGSDGNWSANDFEPMLGHVTQAGKMDGAMFDSMLFLPNNPLPDSKDGWLSYLSDIFGDGNKLSALDEAVGQTNQLLNRPHFKEKVVLTIPYPSYGTNDFGEIDGVDVNFGGSPSDPNAVAARTKALQWYINQILTEWKSANFQHLQLTGLYWDAEDYHIDAPGESDLLKSVESLAQQNNLPLFWIPFYGATGSGEWNQLGFNAAWIQPNFIEQGPDANSLRISNAMATAQTNGMGIEVELTGLDSASQQLYAAFLNKLNQEGFAEGQVSHVFYDAAKLLLQAESSPDPSQRAVYDETAAFIQGR